MHQFANFVYAKINLDFDRTLFADEFDKYIYPESQHAPLSEKFLKGTQQLNQHWKMVDPAVYDNISSNSTTMMLDKTTALLKSGAYFKSTSLLQLKTIDSDSDWVKENANNDRGSLMRNYHLDRTWTLKPEFKKLQIVNFILKKLPFKKIVSIRAPSMDQGDFSCIHRDARYSPNVGLPFDKNNGLNNNLFQQGYVTIALNISDGGVPLYWALDGIEKKKAYKTNDQVYLHADYFLHGVPVCTSRRRQVRITGIPNSRLFDLIDHSSKVVLPDNYKFEKVDKEDDLHCPG